MLIQNEATKPKPKVSESVTNIRALASSILKETAKFQKENRSNGDLESAGMKFPLSFYERVRQFEIGLIRSALELCDYNQGRAASLLGLGRTTLYAKMLKYQLVRKRLARNR